MRARFLQYGTLRSIHFISAIAMLWGLSDAIVSFTIPIQVESHLHNLVLFGLLLSISSISGALSDPVLGFISSKTRYVVLLLGGLFLSVLVAVTAMLPLTIILILWLMIAWGLYYEFIEIGIFSYVSRHHRPEQQSRYFGIIYLFMNLAYVVGPLLGGYLLTQGTSVTYSACLIFLGLAIVLLPRLIFLHRHRERPLFAYHETEHYSFRRQVKAFWKVWRYASAFFIAAFLFNVWDAFIWTLVPIQSIGGNALLSGLITSIFTLPLALLSAYGGTIADRFGRNITFMLGLFAAAVFTLGFGLQNNIFWQVPFAGLAALGFAFAAPAFMGETSREGQEHESQLGNIAAVQRMFTNAGFIFGPIAAGLFGNIFGTQRAFAVLGVIMLAFFIPIIGVLVRFHLRGRIHKELTVEFKF